jgi:predicted metalloprotease
LLKKVLIFTNTIKTYTMKKILGSLSLGLLLLTSLTSCQKEEATETRSISVDADYNTECSYVDRNWGSNAYINTYIINQTQTNLMYSQSSRIANILQVPTVTLRFVHDNTSSSSTANAISYSTGKIYFGETLYRQALNYGQIVPIMVLAHEYGHQVQYRYSSVPSVYENTARATELEADGYAGYYIRRGYGASWDEAGPGFNFAYSIGDYYTSSAGHHGTPPQRRSATRLGWYLGAYNLSATSFDQYFFYYYNQYVLPGNLKTVQKPKYINDEIDQFISSKLEELIKINNGEITAEEFEKL